MLPKSATNFGFNVIGLLGFFVTLYIFRNFTIPISDLSKILILLASAALPIIFCEVVFEKTYKNPSTGLDFSRKFRFDGSRVLTKLTGLYGIFAFLAFLYFLFPEYQGKFYTPYYDFLKTALPIVVILAIPYFAIMDSYLVEPEDAYWQMGRAFLLKREFGKDNLQLFLGWLVKAFFLPLMFLYTFGKLNFLTGFQLSWVLSSFQNMYSFLYNFIFAVDLLWVTFGYMCTFRILDSHIRSAEPSFLGWATALFCYQPFWDFFARNYTVYGGSDKQWGYWFSGTFMYPVWGVSILFLLSVYLWATLCFGIRFSNLTHRGIITNGPYRFTKHPAYVSKMLAYWLITMPFMISTSFLESLRHSMMLMALNYVYYLRAKTEERHLSQDPVYRQYVDYISKHGIFAWGTSKEECVQETLEEVPSHG